MRAPPCGVARALQTLVLCYSNSISFDLCSVADETTDALPQANVNVIAPQ